MERGEVDPLVLMLSSLASRLEADASPGRAAWPRCLATPRAGAPRRPASRSPSTAVHWKSVPSEKR